MSVPQVRGIGDRSIERPWPHNEPPGEQTQVFRTAFEVLLDVCGGLDDPDVHDGWQPVRARSERPKAE